MVPDCSTLDTATSFMYFILIDLVGLSEGVPGSGETWEVQAEREDFLLRLAYKCAHLSLEFTYVMGQTEEGSVSL